MTERFPDLELYLLKGEANSVQQWLEQALNMPLQTVKQHADHTHWRADLPQGTMDVLFNANAERNFASLWFKQNHTPWATDLDCARAAHQALGIEIRCTDSSWQENEQAEHAGWVKLIRGEEKSFSWD